VADAAHPSKGKDFLKYPRDWWQYVRGPGAFFASVDLDGTDEIVRSAKHLGLGLAGTVAFSAVNLKLSGISGAEDTAKLLQGSVLAHTLFLGCLVSILIAHLLSWVCRGEGKPRRTFVAFAYTYAFVWPTLSLAMILIGWYIQLTLGVPWVELPPLGVSQSIRIERTFGNLLLAAVPVTALIWMIVFVGYGYVRAVMTAQKMGPVRACLVAGGNILVLRLIQDPLSSTAHKVALILDPLIGWLFKLL